MIDIFRYEIRPLFCWLSAALLCAATCTLNASAQVDDVFADVPAAGRDLVPLEPEVRAIVEQPHNTPQSLLQAGLQLIDLGATREARSLIDQLLSQDLSTDERAQLVAQVSTAPFLRLARIRWPSEDEALPQTWPELSAFTDSCLAAAGNVASDSQRLAELVGRLTSEKSAERRSALAGLASGGEAAVIACVEQLAQADDPALRRGLRSALVVLHPAAKHALIATLSSSRPQLLVDSMLVLGHTGVDDALPQVAGLTSHRDPDLRQTAQHVFRQLTGRAASSTAAAQVIWRALEESQAEDRTWETNEDDQAVWWIWDDGELRLSSLVISPSQAQRLRTGRLADVAAAVQPQRRDFISRILPWQIEAALVVEQVGPTARGQSEVIAASLAQLTTAELGELLTAALQRELPGAAVALIGELAKRRDVSALQSFDGRPGPLAESLASGWRGVRAAAAAAIVAIDPVQPYAGSQRFLNVVDEILRHEATPAVLIAMPTQQQAVNLAALLSQSEWRAVPVGGGRNAILAALQTSRHNLEMAWIDVGLPDVPVREVVYELRNAPATKHLPLAILSSAGQHPRARRIARDVPGASAHPRPHDAERAVGIATKLAAGDGIPRPAGVDASTALAWLAELAPRQSSVYKLWQLEPALVNRLHDDELSAAAASILSHIGTTTAQRALARQAMALPPTEAARQAAGAALDASVGRFGDLLDGATRRTHDAHRLAQAAEDRETTTDQPSPTDPNNEPRL